MLNMRRITKLKKAKTYILNYVTKNLDLHYFI